VPKTLVFREMEEGMLNKVEKDNEKEKKNAPVSLSI